MLNSQLIINRWLVLFIAIWAYFCAPACFALNVENTTQSVSSDTQTWRAYMLNLNDSPVDLSFLNADQRPAGKHGFLKTQGDKLVFEDGTVVRFWGTNIAANALFNTSKDNVKAQARRLSSLGFNLVRIHHHDSFWVSPNIFGDIKHQSGEINEDSIEKIDWWIKCLKDEGIYVWLDLHVQRSLTAKDKIFAFDELIDKKYNIADLKGFNYIDTSIQTAMQKFNESYLNHLNPYTGKAYKDDPAIATVLITNENDVTNHFGNILLPDKGVPKHSLLYMSKARTFADSHDLSFNIVKYFGHQDESTYINQLQRKIDQTWKAWEYGPSKLFLNDLEHEFNLNMIQHLKKLGVKIPIITTSTWGGNTLSALPSLTDGDMVDAHAYQDGVGVLTTNPLLKTNFIDWLAAAQVVNKPMSISEWNATAFPAADRHVLPLYIASQASFQGWDSVIQFAYSQSPLQHRQVQASPWDSAVDPSFINTSPVAALLYRRGDVNEAKTNYVLDAGEQIFYSAISPDNSKFIRTATEVGKLSIAMPAVKDLPWLAKSPLSGNMKIYTNKNESLIAENAVQSQPDNAQTNAQMIRNWQTGILTIDTPKTQAAAGKIANQDIKLSDVEIKSLQNNVVISLQSLDNVAIKQSRNLMIGWMTNSVPTKDNLSFLIEPIKGELIIKAQKGLTLYSNQIKTKQSIIKTSYDEDGYHINLENMSGKNFIFLSE